MRKLKLLIVGFSAMMGTLVLIQSLIVVSEMYTHNTNI